MEEALHHCIQLGQRLYWGTARLHPEMGDRPKGLPFIHHECQISVKGQVLLRGGGRSPLASVFAVQRFVTLLSQISPKPWDTKFLEVFHPVALCRNMAKAKALPSSTAKPVEASFSGIRMI